MLSDNLSEEPPMESLSLEAMAGIVGGADTPQSWNEILDAARPHCKNTVEANPDAPTTREQAQAIGDACIAEMGRLKATLGGGRNKIQAGIDAAFPK
jgi:hypothetical protein